MCLPDILNRNLVNLLLVRSRCSFLPPRYLFSFHATDCNMNQLCQSSPKRKQPHESDDDNSPPRPTKKPTQKRPRKTEEEKEREKAEKVLSQGVANDSHIHRVVQEAQKAAKKAETLRQRELAKQAKVLISFHSSFSTLTPTIGRRQGKQETRARR